MMAIMSCHGGNHVATILEESSCDMRPHTAPKHSMLYVARQQLEQFKMRLDASPQVIGEHRGVNV